MQVPTLDLPLCILGEGKTFLLSPAPFHLGSWPKAGNRAFLATSAECAKKKELCDSLAGTDKNSFPNR